MVAGFHRSGTSLFCQLLHRAGLFLGYEMLGATFSNQHGHYEDTEVLELHRDILSDNGRTWRVGEPFLPIFTEDHWRRMRKITERRDAEHELWGFKDPRACLFMPIWKHLLPNARVLLVYRHFSEATFSLVKRQAIEMLSGLGPRDQLGQFWEQPDLALRMWLAHNEALLAFARAYPEDTLAVSMDMARDGFPVVEAINRHWKLGLQDLGTSEVFDPDATVDRRGRQPVSDEKLVERVEAVWEALEGLSRETRLAMGGEATVGGE